MNDIFQIETVETRAGASMVIALCGQSGDGKTYTAMELAMGIAGGDATKIGFMDAENRRGKLYADLIPGFKYGDFRPPHSPARYIQGVQHFEKQKVEVLIIDSFSHEWEGMGGCEDIAYEGNPKVARWNLAKAEHKKCMNAILQSPMHIILCLRAREKVKAGRDAQGKLIYESLGIMPITEKNVLFEMTASLMMHANGKAQDVIKCPEALKPYLGRGNNYITREDGEALRAWINGGSKVNLALEALRARMEAAAAHGRASLEAAFKALTPKEKKAVTPIMGGIAEAADAFDAQARISTEAGDTSDATALVQEAISGGGNNALTD